MIITILGSLQKYATTFLAAAVLCLIALPARSEDLIGCNFMPRIGNTFYTEDRAQVSESSPTMPYVIDKVDGDWCRVRKWWCKLNSLVSLKDAPAYYTEMIRGGSDPGPLLYLRGHAWKSRGENKLAAFDYSDAMKMYPKDEQLYRYRADAYYSAKETDKAILDLRQAIRMRPEYELSSLEFAWLLATSPDDGYRNSKKALDIIQKLIDSNGENPEYLVIMAAAYADSNQFEDAVACQAKAIADMEKKRWNEKLINLSSTRLELFRQGKPFRDESRNLSWYGE